MISAIRTLAVCCLAVVCGTLPAWAHHAAGAVFTDETIEIEGYVTEFNFHNPHVSIMLSVSDEVGAGTQWMITGPSATPFRLWGWTADTVQAGQYIRFSGKKSRTGVPMLLIERDDIQAGKFVELNPADGSVIRELLGTIAEPEALDIDTVPLRLSDGRPNFTGNWIGGPREPRPQPPFNAVGAAQQADFDVLNDPTFATCSDPGLVRQAGNTIHPVRITQFEDRVVFEYEEYAGRREIYLDGRAPETAEHTRFGHHVARYEEDTLVIETTRLLGNLSGPPGNALSDQTTTVETYRRTDDPKYGPMIEMNMVITDPGHLTAPWNKRWFKVYTTDDYEFLEVNCKLPLSASGRH
jgi:hypothetical protein